MSVRRGERSGGGSQRWPSARTGRSGGSSGRFQRRHGPRADRRPAPGAVRDRPGRGRRAGLRRPGRAARADGAAGLPGRAGATRTTPQDAFQATFLVLVQAGARALGAGFARPLAAPGRLPDRVLRPDDRGPPPPPRTTTRPIAAQETRPERDFELERLLHEEIDRLPERYRVAGGALRPRGPHPRAGRAAPGLAGRHGQEPARPRPRTPPRPAGPPRRRLADVGVFSRAWGRRPPCSPSPLPCWMPRPPPPSRFAAIGPAVRGSAASLAQGVLRTMTMTQWWKVATVLLVAGATASGVEWLDQGERQGTQAPAAKQDKDVRAGDAPTREVKPGRLKADRLQPAVRSRPRGPWTSTTGRGRDDDHQDRARRASGSRRGISSPSSTRRCSRTSSSTSESRPGAAEANYLNAELTREVAEIALNEYTEGIFKAGR